ncbi:MAG: family 43 glycosylhydrolase [Chitinispirillaceae bacterium]
MENRQTGHDEGGEGWTLRGWHVLSSADMVHWTDHGGVLSCEDISWLNTRQAWASQCVERDGKFYFYICDSGEIGVAVADNVLGPYTDALGHPLITNQTPGACPDNDNIDPAVFIDDDGQAFIYWGTDGVVRQAKLKDSMIEIDGVITEPQGLSYFFEASWVHKKDGIYYYTYAAHKDNGDAWLSNINYDTIMTDVNSAHRKSNA